MDTLKLGYIFLTVAVLVFLFFMGGYAIRLTSKQPKRDQLILFSGLVLWQVYVYTVCWTGFMKSYEFPPRFALLLILPLFLFTAIFLFKNRNKKWIRVIPEHWIIYFQAFRIIVEILFVFSVAKEILNVHVTIEGYNFDMIFGFSAPLIAFFAYTSSKKLVTKKGVLIWNYVGLLVLSSVIFVFITCVYAPWIYGSQLPLLPLVSMEYPYVLIAGFLMPVAVFLHGLSIVQLTRH